jgi:hypothetical protein
MPITRYKPTSLKDGYHLLYYKVLLKEMPFNSKSWPIILGECPSTQKLAHTFSPLKKINDFITIGFTRTYIGKMVLKANSLYNHGLAGTYFVMALLEHTLSW